MTTKKTTDKRKNPAPKTAATKGGRKKKPTALKVLQGTNRKDRENEGETFPDEDKVAPPVTLCPVGKAEFERILWLIDGTHLVTNADVPALAMYCETFACYRSAVEDCRKHGETTITENGNWVQTPHVQLRNKYFEQMFSMLSAFGLTPASRSKVIVKQREADAKDKPKDAWGDFKNG